MKYGVKDAAQRNYLPLGQESQKGKEDTMSSVSGGSSSSGYDRPQAPQNVQGKQNAGKTHRHRHDNSQQGPAQKTAPIASAASATTIESIIKNHLQCREG